MFQHRTFCNFGGTQYMKIHWSDSQMPVSIKKKNLLHGVHGKPFRNPLVMFHTVEGAKTLPFPTKRYIIYIMPPVCLLNMLLHTLPCKKNFCIQHFIVQTLANKILPRSTHHLCTACLEITTLTHQLAILYSSAEIYLYGTTGSDK